MTTLDPIIVDQLDGLLTGETNPITVLANASALLNDLMTDLNWAGFYLYNDKTGQLDLGPFQGKVACMHIQPENGVVGTSYAQNAVLRVPNVHEFAGHIACDSASNAEIVVPITVDNRVVAIMDIDSPTLDRFSENDEAILTKFGETLAAHLDTAALNTVY
ncbi:GAF domain-containing protein [Lacticaseibacillus paracasei]|uniref:GAF domain-containing protein n=1 Tax=Lacticaseibacillus paracasei TaxID=1597 RepID=UPI000297E98A|nr:GAF domain-containing protein [Lacticaseibacillus paracasei]EKQ22155.1 GAF domain-containing protein [Lacticaseibacillus casei UW4]MBU6043779.1 GAF domain-containing protein [Lacticaseibacillus paracasei]MCL4968599.1 GAF domain-containing protein [Lacticaseibacillus paracasei]